MAALSLTSSFQECVILKNVQRPDQDIQLGEGAYGRVFEVQYAGKICAAKEIHSIFFRVSERDGLDKIKRNFFRECSIWSTLHHPNIVTLIGVYYCNSGDNPDIPIMVMEKMDCSLRFLIDRQKDDDKHFRVDLRAKLAILHDVSVGLWHLHNQEPPVIHRDLTPNNVLLRRGTHCFEAKISDLGVSKVIKNTNSGCKMTQVPGTPDFMPPETFYDNPKYGKEVDIFSYAGIVLYAIVEQWPTPKAREKLNSENHKTEIVSEVERRQEYLSKMTGIGEKLKPLVISCLDDDPTRRPDIPKVSTVIKTFKENSDYKVRQVK